jgi:hypothetical protein
MSAGLKADAHHPCQEADHRVPPLAGRPLQPLQACLLDLSDLLAYEAQARHVAAQLREGVRRQRDAFGRAQRLQAPLRVPHRWLEAADAEAS